MALSVFTRLIKDTGIPIEDDDISFRSRSLESFLTKAGCPKERYNEVYEAGLVLYKEEGFGKGPVSNLYFMKAWDVIRNREAGIVVNDKFDAHAYDQAREEARRERRDCSECKGTGLTFFIDEDGRRKILYDVDDTSRKTPVSCAACKEG